MDNPSFAKPQIWLIDVDHAGQRMDNFLLKKLKGVPKSHIYRIVRKGEVRVNKKRIKPDYKLRPQDEVRIPPLRLSMPEKAPARPSMSLQTLLTQRILYEDSNLLIINKPSGMAVHGGSGVSLGVIEALRSMKPHNKHLELVHRLDRDTSGCLLLAKKPSILKQLHELMRNQQIEKIYHVLVKGKWPKHLTHVDAPLKKYELRSGERMVYVHTEGKNALTKFRVIKQFDTMTLLEATLKTGRTHQIRVHAAHVGHPVVGDEKYGDKAFNKQCRQQGCKRLFLHASELAFELPPDAQRLLRVQAELDADLQSFLIGNKSL